jgi:hypothetical protein
MAAKWVKLYLKDNVLKPSTYPQPVHCYDTNPPTSRTLCTVTTRLPCAPTVSNLVVTAHADCNSAWRTTFRLHAIHRSRRSCRRITAEKRRWKHRKWTPADYQLLRNVILCFLNLIDFNFYGGTDLTEIAKLSSRICNWCSNIVRRKEPPTQQAVICLISVTNRPSCSTF